MTLSQQLREAGEKATPGAWEVGIGADNELPCVDAFGADGWRLEICECWGTDEGDVADDFTRANAKLIVLLHNNLDTIIAALEAQEAK